MMRVLFFLVSSFFILKAVAQKDSAFTYYENGNVKSLTILTTDSTKQVMRYYKTGELNVSASYLNDQLSGPFITYFKNAKVLSKEFFKQDAREGGATYYYKSGELKRAGNFKNDFYSGRWLTYHVNGAIKNDGNYLDGNPDGNWLFYDEKARRSSEVVYNKGDKVKYTTYKPRSQKIKSQFLIE